MADFAHQKGNGLYKQGDLEGAAQAFQTAARLDSAEPKYASNLSAVYYEQGQYSSAIESIFASWRALRAKHGGDGVPTTPLVTDPLAFKLALRFVKCKLNSVANKSLCLHDKKPKKKAKTGEGNASLERDLETFIHERVCGASGASDHQDLVRGWNAWSAIKKECSEHTAEDCRASLYAAGKHFRGLPIYRKALDPVLEYYRFGNDPTRSLLYGIDNLNANSFTLDDDVFIKEAWKDAAFLFGGSGDARHAFGTMIHFLDLWKKLARVTWSRKTLPKLHMTLVDIHPAALARAMMIFALMRKGAQAANTAKLEIESTIFYTFSCILMPGYCIPIINKTSREIIEELQGKAPTLLTKSWQVDEASRERVIPIFKYWSEPLSKTTEKMLQYNGPSSFAFGMAPPRKMSLARNEKFQEMLAHLSSQGLLRVENDPRFPTYNNCRAEEKLYDDFRVLLPPKPLIGRYPILTKYARTEGREGRSELMQEVKREWKPNPTLFDNRTTESEAFSAEGYPVISGSDPFQTVCDCLMFTVPFADGRDFSLDQTSFSVMQQFFASARTAMEVFGDDLVVEFLCRDMCSGVSQLVEGDLGPRPLGAPKKYLRMWLSNTPDYTGSILTNTVYLGPYLDQSKHAMMIWNCLLSPPSFNNLREMCFNYTYLNPKDAGRFFGTLIRDEHRGSLEEFNMSVVPRTTSFSSTVSKRKTCEYLSRMLLRAICCPRSNSSPRRVDEPTNLVSYFRLLAYLCEHAGCPTHWVGDFAQGIVNDSVVTDLMPYTGVLPIKEGAVPAKAPCARKVNLEPWQAELETILVTAKDALPFYISLPERYTSSLDDIKTYTAPVVLTAKNRIETNYLTKTVTLVFYKSPDGARDSSVLQLANRIPDLIEKRSALGRDTQVQILTSQEDADVLAKKPYVSWKMSEGWFEKMRREGWCMFVFLTSYWKAVSKPVEAALWSKSGEDIATVRRTTTKVVGSELDHLLFDLD
ncbi:hypothetical protein FA15DRAFT_760548 [Coprinopsis marcescibilis]|uniref:DUF4470 domain-containing protein n=1 Tax=Coprinopsis marcescibilis TaxID=230819 RepID=A0A5C3KFF9_COPMA|nr:hypothetical protein FA15DRAFT_760548 [Coprinopsis marcescibilis]